MKTKLISSIALILASGSLFAEDNVKNHETESGLSFSNQKFKFFMEVGVQKGGDGTGTLPLYNRVDGLFYSGISLTSVGDWNDVSEDLPQTWDNDVEAGGFFKVAAGVQIPLGEKLTVLASLGHQYDEVYGDLTDGSGGNGSFSYERLTFEVIPFVNFGRHRVGLGGEFHFNVQGEHREYATGTTNFHLRTKYDFDNVVGGVFRYDYLVNENVSVGLKYTDISYDFDRISTRFVREGTVITDIDTGCTSNCDDLVEANSVGVHLTYSF